MAISTWRWLPRPTLARAARWSRRCVFWRLPLAHLLEASGAAMGCRIVEVLRRHAREIAVPDLAVAAADIRAMAQALIDADPEAPPPDIEDRVVRAALGYLTTSIKTLNASDQAAVGSKARG